MDKQIFIVIACALGIVLPITIYIIEQIDRRDKIQNNIGATYALRNNKGATLYKIYCVLIRFPPTRRYIDRISRRYEHLYPGELKEINIKTIKTTLLSWVLCISLGCALIINHFSFYNLGVGIILIYVINHEIINVMLTRSERRMMEDMLIFISNVRHNYYINRMIDDAIFLSLDGLGVEMKAHGDKIYKVITSNDIKEQILKYNATINNKYLKMLLSLCSGIMEFSDKKINDQYLFTSNLENLKKEINIEILKQKKLSYLFSGITFVTIAVITPIDAIGRFGVAMMPELSFFYNGRPGLIFVVITLLVTIFIYFLNNRLKESRPIVYREHKYLRKLESIKFIRDILDNYMDKNYGKMLKLEDTLKRIGESISARQLFLKRIIVCVITLITSIFFLSYTHHVNRKNLLSDVNDLSSYTGIINANQKENVKASILTYTSKFKEEKNLNQEDIAKTIRADRIFFNANLIDMIAQEVMGRLAKYQNEYFKWYELLLSIAAAIVSYHLPLMMIHFRKKILQMNMEDEVNQFNSIIYMMMYNDHITVKNLLEELELFAVVFKKTLQECINDYNSGDIEALLRMKERESYTPFHHIVDNLIRCDIISIDQAFDEISADRESYHERRKQENEISVQKKADIAKPLSWIPVCLVMGYLILPLIIQSVKELQMFSEAVQNL